MDEPDRYTTANLPVHLLRCLAETSKELGIDPTRLCLGPASTSRTCRIRRAGFPCARRAR